MGNYNENNRNIKPKYRSKSIEIGPMQREFDKIETPVISNSDSASVKSLKNTIINGINKLQDELLDDNWETTNEINAFLTDMFNNIDELDTGNITIKEFERFYEKSLADLDKRFMVSGKTNEAPLKTEAYYSYIRPFFVGILGCFVKLCTLPVQTPVAGEQTHRSVTKYANSFFESYFKNEARKSLKEFEHSIDVLVNESLKKPNNQI